eukprot:2833265-Prorocentrum_lima.AAC.1
MFCGVDAFAIDAKSPGCVFAFVGGTTVVATFYGVDDFATEAGARISVGRETMSAATLLKASWKWGSGVLDR